MSERRQLLQTAARGIVFGALALSAAAVLAWVGPGSNTPPTCPTSTQGCNTPINIGSTAQTKTGPFNVNGTYSAQWLSVIYNTAGYGLIAETPVVGDAAIEGYNTGNGTYAALGNSIYGINAYSASSGGYAGYFQGASGAGALDASNGTYYTILDGTGYGVNTNGPIFTNSYLYAGGSIFYGWGGGYDVQQGYGCSAINTFTGACSCPAGYSGTLTGAAYNGSQPTDLYDCYSSY